MPTTSRVPEAEEAIAGLRWWHVIEVAPGVLTRGSWDLRPSHYGPPREDDPIAVGARAMHLIGVRGRSAAARARPLPDG